MNSVLEQQFDALSRLATTIRTGLTQAELAVPPINEVLADLAEMGVCNFEYEGPASIAARLADRAITTICSSSTPPPSRCRAASGRPCGAHVNTANALGERACSGRVGRGNGSVGSGFGREDLRQ